MRTSPATAALRQAFIGLVLVLLALPVLWFFSRIVGLGAPPVFGVLLLGGSAVGMWAVGGFGGALWGSRPRGPSTAGMALIAAVCGLVGGGVACSVVAPIYIETVLDAVAHEAAGEAWQNRTKIIGGARDVLTSKPEGAADTEDMKQRAARIAAAAREGAVNSAPEALATAKRLGASAAARLPAMTLLFWTLLGPAIAAFVETRRALR